MGLLKLTQREVIGRYYLALEQGVGMGWVPEISNYFESNQASEEYAWLGQVPALREYLSGLHPKGLTENSLTIANKEYEATLEVLRTEYDRDKSGQLLIRISELAARTNAHFASLLSTLLLNAPSTACYDGSYFFHTAHSEGSSGTQDNDITVDISGLGVTTHSTLGVTAPSVGEMSGSIMKGVKQIIGFKDNQGEPMNELAQKFLVMVPVSLYDVAVAAATQKFIGSGEENVLTSSGAFQISVAANARLTWTDSFAVFRTDGTIKPFIRQEEVPPEMDAVAQGSEYAIINKKHLYTVYTRRNVGYGLWQHACYVTMV